MTAWVWARAWLATLGFIGQAVWYVAVDQVRAWWRGEAL